MLWLKTLPFSARKLNSIIKSSTTIVGTLLEILELIYQLNLLLLFNKSLIV
jgi:hypothetical protein